MRVSFYGYLLDGLLAACAQGGDRLSLSHYGREGIPMPRIRLTIVSDLFDVSPQEVSIRENLPVRTFLTETRKEFMFPEEDIYSLRVESTGKALEPDKTLEQQNVQTGAQLVLVREQRARGIREAVAVRPEERRVIGNGVIQPYFREQGTGKIFELRFQPALIGRPDPQNPQTAEALAVNLGNFEGAKSVSRYHARITEDNGQFYLESLADHNPAYLNRSIVRVGERRLVLPNDIVTVGKFDLLFGARSGSTRMAANPNAPN